MLGMLLTENQQLQCRPRCSAQCPVLCTATAHYVDTRHPPDVWDLDTSNTGAGRRLHSTLYITSPSPPPPIVIVLLRHGPMPCAPLYANTAGRSAAGGVVAGQGVWESGAPSEINSTLPPPLTLPTIQGRLVLCYPTRVALNMLCDGYLLFYCLHTNSSLYEMYECQTHAKCLTDYFLFSFSP